MICSRAWWALMRRNMIYRKRHWIGTVRQHQCCLGLAVADVGRVAGRGGLSEHSSLTKRISFWVVPQILEIGLPIAFVGILLAIKNSVQGTSSFAPKVIEPTFPPNEVAYTPLSFGDYVIALQATRVCVGGGEDFNITGIYNGGENWQVPMVKCDSRRCKVNGESALPYCEFGAVGVAPSATTDAGGQARALDFAVWLYETYPALYNRSGELPFSFQVVQNFSSPTEIDDYVESEAYGSDEMHPKLVMAVVFEGNDVNAYKYSLRQNSTNFNAPEAESRPTARTTPSTSTLFASYAKTDFEVCTSASDGAPDQGILTNSCTGLYLYV